MDESRVTEAKHGMEANGFPIPLLPGGQSPQSVLRSALAKAHVEDEQWKPETEQINLVDLRLRLAALAQ